MARSLVLVAATLPYLATSNAVTIDSARSEHTSHLFRSSSALVEKVRQATEAFPTLDTVPEGYGQLLGCVSGPQEGAMGVHFVDKGLVDDGDIEVSTPEALIYEIKHGVGRLVGVEYLVMVDVWNAHHPTPDHSPVPPPVLEGQSFQLTTAPNRFNLPAFYELHVWAWRENPRGAYVDWNTMVTCEGQ